MTWEYWIQCEVFESSGIGDGSGWFETATDWCTVEADNWREARKLGRAKVQLEHPLNGVVAMNRRDGIYPFSKEHCRIFKVLHEGSILDEMARLEMESPMGLNV